MSEPVITIEDNPPEKDIRVLWDGIGEYNFSQTGLKGQAILVFLRNEQHQVIGGGYGWAIYTWLHVRVLWLREDQRQRGWGTRILQATEAEAIKRGCRHSHLETFSFQGLGFYQRNGYQVFAELEKLAGDHKLYFLKKDLC